MTFHSLHLSNLCRDLLTAVLDSGRNVQKSMAFLFSSANHESHGKFHVFSDIFEVNPLVAVWLIWKPSFWRRQNLREWAQRWTWCELQIYYEILCKTHIFTKYCFILMLCFGAKYMLEALTDNILPHDVPSEDGGEAEEPTWISHWKGPWNVFVTMPVFHEFFALRLQRWHEFKKFEVQINYKLHRYDRL